MRIKKLITWMYKAVYRQSPRHNKYSNMGYILNWVVRIQLARFCKDFFVPQLNEDVMGVRQKLFNFLLRQFIMYFYFDSYLSMTTKKYFLNEHAYIRPATRIERAKAC